MKQFVKELTAIANGSADKLGRQDQKKRTAFKSLKKIKHTPKKTAIRTDRIIPFEENKDFMDF